MFFLFFYHIIHLSYLSFFFLFLLRCIIVYGVSNKYFILFYFIEICLKDTNSSFILCINFSFLFKENNVFLFLNIVNIYLTRLSFPIYFFLLYYYITFITYLTFISVSLKMYIVSRCPKNQIFFKK